MSELQRPATQDTSPGRPRADQEGAQVLYGFLREETFTSARQAADSRSRMFAFAERWNYRLTKVYTEKAGNAPKAFNQFRAAVQKDGAAVVVPSAGHLSPYGDLLAIVAELEKPSGQHVMQSEPVQAP